MPQVTLSVPHEKLSLFSELLDVLGIDNYETEDHTADSFISSTNITNSSNSFFKKYFTWEYYKNELEFE